MAYDEKFKQCVIDYKESGHTFKALYEAFHVDSKPYYRWKALYEETGSLKNKLPAERKRKIDKAELLRLVNEHPDWYLSEFAERFDVWPQSVSKRFAKLGVTRKKKRLPTVKNRRKKGKSI